MKMFYKLHASWRTSYACVNSNALHVVVKIYSSELTTHRAENGGEYFALRGIEVIPITSIHSQIFSKQITGSIWSFIVLCSLLLGAYNMFLMSAFPSRVRLPENKKSVRACMHLCTSPYNITRLLDLSMFRLVTLDKLKHYFIEKIEFSVREL